MKRLRHKHDRAIRYSHWVNGPVLLVMIWSGMLILWADTPYGFSVFGLRINFFPQWLYAALGMQFKLALGMAFHFAFAWIFGLNGLFFVLYSFWAGHWRELRPTRRTPVEAFHVVLHDLGIREQPPPPGKFNAAQKVAYTGIIVLGACSVVTGLAIYKPTSLSWLTSLLGGYRAARFEHFLCMIGYMVFFAVHITQVIRAGWNNGRSMITGAELVPEEPADVRSAPAA